MKACMALAIDDNYIPREKIMAKKTKKTKKIHDQQKRYALRQVKDLQTLRIDEVKLHLFSTQLSRLIDAIPDAVLLKDREGRKLVTHQLTKSLFKLHDLDWYGKTDISSAFAHQEIRADHEPGRTLKSELDYALERDQLKLYYQIQVDSARRILGAEALLRWEHPQYGLVVPDQFIPIAEQTGLILPIGAWVLQAACEQLKLWQSDPLKKHLPLSVNISPLQFSQAEFFEQLCRILEQTGIDATRLKLELTESMMLHDIGNIIEKMEALKKLGIQFSMDNFGTGYSSLSQLKKLPIDQLKIDPFLMRDVAIGNCDTMIVKTIMDMTKKLGIKVVVGGVETEQQFICLNQLGCPAYQGYLFGKPMPINETD